MSSLNKGVDKTQTDTNIPLLAVFIHHHQEEPRDGGVLHLTLFHWRFR